MTHRLRLGILSRTTPVSTRWGTERGTPLDRHFIEIFIASHRADIRGRVLEVKDAGYSQRFGLGVERCDVIDIDADNPKATIVDDLAIGDFIPDAEFDCFICTQTLQLIYNFQAAIANMHRLLRPGGTLLLTVPTVSRLVADHGYQTDYWRFTQASCQRMFGETFGASNVQVTVFGNPMTAGAFMHGLSREEIPRAELDVHNRDFPVLCGVRAVRAD